MKRTVWRFGIGVVLLLSINACKDEKKNAKPADINEPLAVQSAQNTISAANTLMTQDNGIVAAETMLTIGLSYQSLLVPQEEAEGDYYDDDDDDGGGFFKAMISNPVVRRQALSDSTYDDSYYDEYYDDELTGTCDCNEASKTCTFQDCGDADGEAVMNGTISWGNGKIVCDLNMSGSIDEYGTTMEYEVTLKADLTVTETSIDGTIDTTLSADMTYEGDNYSVDMESHVTFNSVTWSATTMQPNGGSIDVEASMSARGGGDSASYEGSATINF